jgi:hypothetical protein
MARRKKKYPNQEDNISEEIETKVSTTEDTEESTTEEATPEEQENMPKIAPQTVESAAIIEKAIKATSVKTAKAPTEHTDTYSADGTVPAVVEPQEQPSKYDVLLGRYCKVVSDYMNGTSKKRPIGSFVSLMDYVVNSKSQTVYNNMLKFFILEANGIMSPHNALNGIETLNDLTMKTRVMTASTVFIGLAVQKTTGRRPTFSVGAIRQILKNDRFTNWVNVVMNS